MGGRAGEEGEREAVHQSLLARQSVYFPEVVSFIFTLTFKLNVGFSTPPPYLLPKPLFAHPCLTSSERAGNGMAGLGSRRLRCQGLEAKGWGL